MSEIIRALGPLAAPIAFLIVIVIVGALFYSSRTDGVMLGEWHDEGKEE